MPKVEDKLVLPPEFQEWSQDQLQDLMEAERGDKKQEVLSTLRVLCHLTQSATLVLFLNLFLSCQALSMLNQVKRQQRKFMETLRYFKTLPHKERNQIVLHKQRKRPRVRDRNLTKVVSLTRCSSKSKLKTSITT